MKTAACLQRTIVVSLSLTGAAGHDLLAGVLRGLRQHNGWTMRLLQIPEMLTAEAIKAFEREGVDGIIASEFPHDRKTIQAIQSTTLPFILLGPPDQLLKERKSPTAFVCNDEENIGQEGARYLSSLGDFNSFGFVQLFNGTLWSDLRARGFHRFFAEHGIQSECFTNKDPSLRLKRTGTPTDLQRLRQWLTVLPKPVAIMTDMDFRALSVLNVCSIARLKVPCQVTVLGVDNDKLLCESTSPSLSSIQPDHEQIGFLSIRELHRILTSRAASFETIKCPICGIVERDSTRPATPAGILVRKAMSYIDAHACEDIKVDDVVRHLDSSRSLINLRFRQVLSMSILETITQRRIKEVASMLIKTDYSIKRVSLSCGFLNMKHLKWLFKRHMGISMREFRKRANNGGIDFQGTSKGLV